MEIKRLIGALVLAASVFTAGGCAQTGRSYAADVDPQGWRTGAVLTLPNEDTLAKYDLELFLRCNDRFAEDTLTLRVETITPDSLRYGEFFCIPFPQTHTPRSRRTRSETALPPPGTFRTTRQLPPDPHPDPTRTGR